MAEIGALRHSARLSQPADGDRMLSWEVDFKERHDHRKSLLMCGQALSGDSHPFSITGRRSGLGQGRRSRATVRESALPQKADQPVLQSIIS
jgi:hypothetical protein